MSTVAQERFAEAEYFEDFDPKRFADQIKREAEQRETESAGEAENTDESDGQ